MSGYKWRDGFHPPKGVEAEDVAVAIDKLPRPEPVALLAASKQKRHVLHEYLWSEPEPVWAERGRLEACRKIISAVIVPTIVGGKTMEVRYVEFVKPHGEGKWATLSTIRSDPDLLDAYVAEIQRLQEQASAKMERLRRLMKS